jgi:ADP-ribose pyrophosphatase YjhB (NUDIX family)
MATARSCGFIMIIGANGIVINEYGDVLLVRRDDTRSFAPPGGACEVDEFPIDTAGREVQEETGLNVSPIRLTGLYFLPIKPTPFLFLCYRCIPRDGKLSESTETTHTGFFKKTFLPRPMLAFHQEEVLQAYSHRGGPPDWDIHQVNLKMRAGLFFLNRLVYPWLKFRRSLQEQPQYVPPPQWQVRAKLILMDSSERVLLLGTESKDYWGLPSSKASLAEPPWVKANQLIQDLFDNSVVLKNLSGIYIRRGKPEMEFVFSGIVANGFQPQTSRSAYFETGSLPQNLASIHQTMIEDLLDQTEEISYKLFN